MAAADIHFTALINNQSSICQELNNSAYSNENNFYCAKIHSLSSINFQKNIRRTPQRKHESFEQTD